MTAQLKRGPDSYNIGAHYSQVDDNIWLAYLEIIEESRRKYQDSRTSLQYTLDKKRDIFGKKDPKKQSRLARNRG